MPGKKAVIVILSTKQEQILKGLSKGTHIPLHLKQRSSIVLMSFRGENNYEISRKLKLSYDCVSKWRSRYAAAFSVLEKTEDESPLQLRKEITSVLSDSQRSGAPPRFTPEQVASIIALSCEEPGQLGLPFSHWTPALLKKTVIDRGIITSISERQIRRFFKRSRPSAESFSVLAEPSHREFR